MSNKIYTVYFLWKITGTGTFLVNEIYNFLINTGIVWNPTKQSFM
jgi:hypothetical protein